MIEEANSVAVSEADLLSVYVLYIQSAENRRKSVTGSGYAYVTQ